MAEVKTLSQFKSKLVYGGAISNLFEVSIPSFLPQLLIFGMVVMMVKESSNSCVNTDSKPSTVNQIEVPFRGRTLKVARGERTFATWNVTVMNDEDFKLRTALKDGLMY